MGVLPDLQIDYAKETERICSFIDAFVRDRGAGGIVLGLSGGLDSSVVAALCARALTPGRVYALLLPERDSSPESVEDAKRHATLLGIEHDVQDLTSALSELKCYESGASDLVRFRGGTRAAVKLFPNFARKGFVANLEGGGGKQFQEFLAFHRIKHRLRMVAVYREAERRNMAAASCANRTEFETGFFVRYGDDAGDIAPIKHLFKTQVFGIGRELGLPEEILKKKPSPDLFAGMKDEEVMGISYRELDGILFGLSQGLTNEEIIKGFSVRSKTIGYVKEIKKHSDRLRTPPVSLME
ncbi:MAG: NAD(+) synthase [bacterium]|nr:MAG: NAD(+) synthase [bacterium]